MKIDLNELRKSIVDGKHEMWNQVVGIFKAGRTTLMDLEVQEGYLISAFGLPDGSWGLVSSPLVASDAMRMIANNYQGDTLLATVDDGMLNHCTRTELFMIPVGVTFVGTSVRGWGGETLWVGLDFLIHALGKSSEEGCELADDFGFRSTEIRIIQLGGN